RGDRRCHDRPGGRGADPRLNEPIADHRRTRPVIGDGPLPALDSPPLLPRNAGIEQEMTRR
ncbi:hypothetical protein, partial [Nocardia sp. NPDC003345]